MSSISTFVLNTLTLIALYFALLFFISFAYKCLNDLLRDHAIPLYIYANVLPLNFRYYHTLSNLMHDDHNNNVPSSILNLFQKTSMRSRII